MKIAIHNSKIGFHPRWINYCIKNNITYQVVDCYANDLIDKLDGCDALMWHFNQGNVKDCLIAKQILLALEHTGFIVFPDFRTSWHFDDKLGQKYLFEAIKAPVVPTYLFFDEREAFDWMNRATFPKVFKLRGGAGSQNVSLVENKSKARRLVHKAFSTGFSKYDSYGSLKERIYKFKKGRVGFGEVLKGFVRLFIKPDYARKLSNEFGYIYFQDFVPNNDSDIRIIVIGNRAFGLKRYVRDGDFRASGSGSFAWNRDSFDVRCVQMSFEITEQLKLQVGAFDFVFDESNNPLIVEVSYGFVSSVYDPCEGYWDRNLNWHQVKTTKEDWMVELILERISGKR